MSANCVETSHISQLDGTYENLQICRNLFLTQMKKTAKTDTASYKDVWMSSERDLWFFGLSVSHTS